VNISQLISVLDLAGVAVFAASGGLVASRKEMDLIGFGLMAALTGLGGGTIRDLIVGREVFWLHSQSHVIVCLVVAGLVFFIAPMLQRRFTALLWADAVGLSVFAVMGTHIALVEGVFWMQAIIFGMMTATFGGLMRDVIAGEVSLFLKPEIYATATLVGGGVYILLLQFDIFQPLSAVLAVIAAFIVRSGGIIWKWELPKYKPRPGREY